ncbi:DUF3024 domain-containing protein [Ruficoccus amylovorans]|uniref:DUF3024 domain-containing protein n=1 Tax=Ruficoccus amylovorans TaxID=1804625 RepID=A0A842HEP0_9BACT|nr:DUF3024 domain-containing protein [Ruficoccus amylovorans]MBC2593781.1 DUF3024 domain-containing protein [Ruficoccus amylovorans]
MALSEFEHAKVEQELVSLLKTVRPPVEMRDQVDVIYRIEGQSIVLIEKRPYWRDPKEFTESEFAKVTFVKSTGTWSVYWKRASGKWERYEPCKTVPTLEAWIRLLCEDAHGCFQG